MEKRRESSVWLTGSGRQALLRKRRPDGKRNTFDKIATRLNLKFDTAPPFGGGTMPVEKEKTMVMLAHFFSWIVWLLMRKQSPAVDAHGKEATNFVITIVILFFLPVSIVSRFLPSSLMMVVSVLVFVVWLALLILVIIAMIKAKEGKLLRYPINFRLIK